jgi:hypothetical protein
MTEQAAELHELFIELDENIRELLSLVKMLKIDIITNADDETVSRRLGKSLFLAERIQANLYSLKREVKL